VIKLSNALSGLESVMRQGRHRVI